MKNFFLDIAKHKKIFKEKKAVRELQDLTDNPGEVHGLCQDERK